MIYVAEGINLRRMADRDIEFTHYRLAHIIDCLENGKDFTAKECGKMLAELQTCDAPEMNSPFRDWAFDRVEELFNKGNEAFKEEFLDTVHLVCEGIVRRKES